jgi:hypothetical protein
MANKPNPEKLLKKQRLAAALKANIKRRKQSSEQIKKAPVDRPAQ